MSSDAELIGRSLHGDTNAFVEVISRHKSAIGSYLARRAGRQTAEDVLGDVWVAAYASRASYDSSYPGARPCLYGVAPNRLRQHWRSEPAEDPAPDVARLASGWDPWPAVDTRVDAQASLRTALARLKPEEREVLSLVAWEDLTVAEAGRVLDIPRRHGTTQLSGMAQSLGHLLAAAGPVLAGHLPEHTGTWTASLVVVGVLAVVQVGVAVAAGRSPVSGAART